MIIKANGKLYTGVKKKGADIVCEECDAPSYLWKPVYTARLKDRGHIHVLNCKCGEVIEVAPCPESLEPLGGMMND